ncbi:MAG: hypothetical protein Q9199_004299 [Rusavskia elegans]
MCGILALIKASASDTSVAADLHEATFMLQCVPSLVQRIPQLTGSSTTGIEARTQSGSPHVRRGARYIKSRATDLSQKYSMVMDLE